MICQLTVDLLLVIANIFENAVTVVSKLYLEKDDL